MGKLNSSCNYLKFKLFVVVSIEFVYTYSMNCLGMWCISGYFKTGASVQTLFLAAQSSSRSLVVGQSVGWSVGWSVSWSVLDLCEKVEVSNGKCKLTFFPSYVIIVMWQ